MIVVYSKPACVQCAATIRKLDALGLAYEVVDLTADAEAMDRVQSWGFKSAPVVDANGERWSGYRDDLIRRLAEDERLNEIADERKDGPTVVVSIDDL